MIQQGAQKFEDMYTQRILVYHKPRLKIIDAILPPVTVNFAPPAVQTTYDIKK